MPLLVLHQLVLQCVDGRREEVLTTPLINPFEVTELHAVGVFLVWLLEKADPTLLLVWTVSLADETIETRAVAHHLVDGELLVACPAWKHTWY